ncbi:histidine kinase [Flavobacterium reichenbachii]|uniref:Histidine kinase n=1 Tax=Flavobacterium reichenbachii TaxID=362418 RepID=A0A085ZIP0_9FLAO|nr:histidine kinase [Flavobacterium reichenbachii]KFF04304.1 histidine kinase [Flavobacterium reichenbachii]OXB11726.1 histidine kinase [Flavobacterium reichenbachii]
MKFTLKNTFAGRYFFFLGIVFIILTLFAAYLLSDLITQVSEKTNAETTQRGFLKRHEIIAAEFSRLLQTPKEVDRIIKFSNSKNLSEHLKVLGTIHNNDSLVKNSWFQINDNKIEFAASKDPKKLETSIRDFILKNGDQKEFSTIVNNKEEFFWRIYSKSNSADGSVVRYGYDIDLKSLQSFFSTIDQNTPNYAFVFDQKGTVLYHPEVNLLQQNIFKITNITPADTSFAEKESFNKKTALSEYLKLDIVRYTKRLDVKGTSWYVCVNFPKEISNEDVNAVKKYASLIYFLTTAILIVFFYFFTLFRRKSFREKEILAEDKNKLLVENEKVNKEKALILLQQLKEQINPHFLFNSLNSLYMLIESDTAVARKFTLNLSKIYRYLINPPDHNIVTLQEEMLFIEKYIFLQQTRFTAEFVFTINMEDENLLSKKVPYLAFQILVENAIKHNIASEDSPLHITIDIKENEVIIRNNLQEKSNPQKGSKFGHKYLKSIYKYYSKTEFKAYKNDGYFICILPLIA